MTLGGEPSTPLERAQHVAHLMGGNGLSTNQQVELIAAKLAQWSRTDCFEAAGFADSPTESPSQVIMRAIWRRREGQNHGPGETWEDYAELCKQDRNEAETQLETALDNLRILEQRLRLAGLRSTIDGPG